MLPMQFQPHHHVQVGIAASTGFGMSSTVKIITGFATTCHKHFWKGCDVTSAIGRMQVYGLMSGSGGMLSWSVEKQLRQYTRHT